MRTRPLFLLTTMALAMMQPVVAQNRSLTLPKTVEAGSAFSVHTAGAGKRLVHRWSRTGIETRCGSGRHGFLPRGSLYNAGHYLAVLAGIRPQRPSPSMLCLQPSPRN